MKKLLLYTIAFLYHLHTWCQPAWDNYEHINTAQGLSHNVVTALHQDSEGFLWIGTYNGLSRYDGNKIVTYKEIFGPIHSENWFHGIETIFEDSKHNLWVGTTGGLISCFNRKMHTWKTYRWHAQGPFLVHCFAEDAAGRMWIGGNGRLGVISGDTVRYIPFDNFTVFLTQVEKNKLLLVTKNGFISYATDSDSFSEIPAETYATQQIKSAWRTGDHLLVEYIDRFVRYRLPRMEKMLEVIPAGVRRSLYNKVIPAKGGDYFFTDANVVNKYNAAGTLVDSFAISDNLSYDKNEIVNCMLEDNSGILWLGTNSGLYKINREKYRFRKYSRNNVEGKLSYNYVRSIYVDRDNQVWVGYKAGKIDRLQYDKSSNRYRLKKNHEIGSPQFEVFTTNTFLQLRNKKILAGCAEGIFYVDEKSGCIRPFLRRGMQPVTEVWALLEDQYGHIWIGTREGGLYITDPVSGTVVTYRNNTGGIGSNNIWNIYQDKQGTIWIATANGLYKAMNLSASISNVKFAKQELGRDISEAIHAWSIAEDAAGNLWVGTTGHGIFRISGDRKKTIRAGIVPNNVISSLLFDQEQQLWVSSPNGLYRYDPVSEKYIQYDEQDGLISNDYNFKVSTVTPSGEVFFGGKMGMVSFQPADLNTGNASVNAPVKLTGFHVNGKDVAAAVGDKKQLQLAHWQNNVEISFAIPEFSKPRSHKFRYILEGFDEAWHYPALDHPFAVYTNIPPGKYNFILEGSHDGVHWSTQKQVIGIHIKPAFWQRPVFWIVLSLCPAIIIALIVYARTRVLVRRERERNRIEKQLAGLELKALQLQMNPHFIFNVINSIQHFIVHKDEVSTNEYLSRFARLMRLFLESSKSKYLPLSHEVELIDLYLSIEKMRFEDKFDYAIKVHCPDPANITIPSMLIQPFVENAVNHGLVHKTSKGHLTVSFIQDKSNLRCVIEDDGIGRKKAAQMKRNSLHISRGLQLIEERIKTYNFISDKNIELNITDKEIPDEGTKVELIIPLVFENANISLP